MAPTLLAMMGTPGTGVSTVALALVWHQVVRQSLLILPGLGDWVATALKAQDARRAQNGAQAPGARKTLCEVLQSKSCALLDSSAAARESVDWLFQDLPQTLPLTAHTDDFMKPRLTGDEPDWLCLGDDFETLLHATHNAQALACFQFGFQRLIANYEVVVWDSPTLEALLAVSTAKKSREASHGTAKANRHKGAVRVGRDARDSAIQPVWVISPDTDWQALGEPLGLGQTATEQPFETQQPVVILNRWPDDTPLPAHLALWLQKDWCRLVARMPEVPCVPQVDTPTMPPLEIVRQPLWQERLAALPNRLGFYDVSAL
jgi:hypothetical protein